MNIGNNKTWPMAPVEFLVQNFNFRLNIMPGHLSMALISIAACDKIPPFEK